MGISCHEVKLAAPHEHLKSRSDTTLLASHVHRQGTGTGPAKTRPTQISVRVKRTDLEKLSRPNISEKLSRPNITDGDFF
jgi:calcineurin-like phosphoesterase family protein